MNQNLVVTHDLVAPPIQYGITPADIESKRAAYAALSAESREGYESVRLAIADCRGLRVEVEKRRKGLKQGVLEYGRAIDAVAAQLTGMLEELESPLIAKKTAVDDERARVKREAEEAKKREIEEKLRAERELEEARIRAEREAEQARMAEERAKLAAERARLDAERAALDEARRKVEEEERVARAAEEARMAAERQKMDEERRALDKQRRAAELAEAERQARAKAEADAERARIAAEEARVAELERKAEEERRLEAIRPDMDKLLGLAAAIRTLTIPDVRSFEVAAVLGTARGELNLVARSLERFASSKGGVL